MTGRTIKQTMIEKQAPTHNDTRYWLALFHTPHCGAQACQSIYQLWLSPQKAFESDLLDYAERYWPANTVQALRHPRWDLVEQDLAWEASSPQHHILTLSDPKYPQPLRQLSAPPPVLFVMGAIAPLSLAQLAIVGSRQASPLGQQQAHEFAYQAASWGIPITSGLARGIDTCSHQGCLKAQQATIAVFGCGIKTIYPNKNQQLAMNIVDQGGCLVSCFPIHSPPKAAHFPQRNHIISGLSQAVLVIEAASRSGSLITAQAALDQGREVLVIPGSIQNALKKGCHSLIRSGATLIHEPSQLLEFFPHAQPTRRYCHTASMPDLSDDQKKLLFCLTDTPTHIDQLTDMTRWSLKKVTALLLNMELNGYIVRMLGGYIRLQP